MPRKMGFRHSEETRSKIQADALIRRMMKIAMGEVDATPAQVNAAKALLNKCLPDLKAVELVADVNANVVMPSQITLVAGKPKNT